MAKQGRKVKSGHAARVGLGLGFFECLTNIDCIKADKDSFGLFRVHKAFALCVCVFSSSCHEALNQASTPLLAVSKQYKECPKN